MGSELIRNANVVNEGKISRQDILITDGIIEKISPGGSGSNGATEFDASELYVFPGLIDDQVHFREPGLTHKADIFSESRAAVAGGITSFMEMPNTVPNTVTIDLLEEKYKRAAEVSLANYSFFMGATNDNLSEVLKADPKNVCGIKVFMGSSTGNMLVDDPEVLHKVFSESQMLVATHCEDEATIRANTALFSQKYGENIPVSAHPLIRSAEACYRSSSLAVELAEKYKSRLHVLHISTAKEVELFSNTLPLKEKRITAEACIHHLWFSDEDYNEKGNFIKWNPAVKTAADREGVIKGLLNNRIDVIATDHAPHTQEEKSAAYIKAPSGGPLVQHALPALLDMAKKGVFSLEFIAEKTAHAVATCFQIANRGFIREGYAADLVIVDLNKPSPVTKESLHYKCKWSPFEGHTFGSSVVRTYVNGNVVYKNGGFHENSKGQRLTFNR